MKGAREKAKEIFRDSGGIDWFVADAAGIMGRNHDISKLLYGEAPAQEGNFSYG
jgi:hypothetical protein